MVLNKSTHSDIITLYQPLVKNFEGKYVAVLSDDSIDRDGEMMSKEALKEVMDNDGYTAILFDHENKVMNQIGEWVNKRIVEIDGHTALVAEPKFFDSNPNAKILKGMLDEGAKMGVSIGAIPKRYIEKKIDGVMRIVYTSLELLEASLVAIPSNRHGMVTAVSKMAKNYKNVNGENNKMELEQIQKDFDAEKSAHEELKKQFDSTKEELVKSAELVKEFDVYKVETEKSIAELKKQVEDAEAAKADVEAKVEAAEKALKDAESKALFKGNFEFKDLDEDKKIEFQKELDSGKLPVFRK